jgi:hypothetical protein
MLWFSQERLELSETVNCAYDINNLSRLSFAASDYCSPERRMTFTKPMIFVDILSLPVFDLSRTTSGRHF